MNLRPAILVGLRSASAWCCWFGLCKENGGVLDVDGHPETSGWEHHFATAYNVLVEPLSEERYRLAFVLNKLRELGPFGADDGSNLPELTEDLFTKNLPPDALLLEPAAGSLSLLIHKGLSEYDRVDPPVEDDEQDSWVLKPWET